MTSQLNTYQEVVFTETTLDNPNGYWAAHAVGCNCEPPADGHRPRYAMISTRAEAATEVADSSLFELTGAAFDRQLAIEIADIHFGPCINAR